eukprot:bmy_20298T0
MERGEEQREGGKDAGLSKGMKEYNRRISSKEVCLMNSLHKGIMQRIGGFGMKELALLGGLRLHPGADGHGRLHPLSPENEPDLAQCFFCFKELEGWEPDDDPIEEHKKHSSGCKQFEELTLSEFLKLDKERAKNKIAKETNNKQEEFEETAKKVRCAIEQLAASGLPHCHCPTATQTHRFQGTALSVTSFSLGPLNCALGKENINILKLEYLNCIFGGARGYFCCTASAKIFILVLNPAAYTLNYKCYNEESPSTKTEDKIICIPHFFSPVEEILFHLPPPPFHGSTGTWFLITPGIVIWTPDNSLQYKGHLWKTKSGDILVRNHLVFPRSSCLIHAAVTVYSLYAPEKKVWLGGEKKDEEELTELKKNRRNHNGKD